MENFYNASRNIIFNTFSTCTHIETQQNLTFVRFTLKLCLNCKCGLRILNNQHFVRPESKEIEHKEGVIGVFIAPSIKSLKLIQKCFLRLCTSTGPKFICY